MSAALPPTNNLIMLAVLGGGAYWFMTRRAVAAPAAAAARPAGGQAPGVMDVLGMASRFFGGGGSPALLGTADGRSRTVWDATPNGPGGAQFNNPSAYVAGDGLAINPVNNSAYDFTNEYWY